VLYDIGQIYSFTPQAYVGLSTFLHFSQAQHLMRRTT